MSPRCFIALFLISFIAAIPAFAVKEDGAREQGGHEVGNGGGAWVCRSEDGSIRWSQLLDLFEAKAEYHLDVPDPQDGDPNVLMNLALWKITSIDGIFSQLLDEELSQVLDHLVPVDEELVPTHDSKPKIMPDPSTCVDGSVQYEQLAVYPIALKRYGVQVNQAIWRSLTPTHRAALYTHEALYALFRKMGADLDSTRARRLNGVLYSTESLDTHRDLLRLQPPDAFFLR